MEKIYNPDIFAKIRYLENAKNHTKDISKRSYKLLNIKKGQTVLEFGCGGGYDVFEMAKLVGDTGKVYGVDIDQDTVEYANNMSIYTNVSFEQNVTKTLSYQDDFFDRVRLERVLQHVESADNTVADLVRVLKKDGQLGVVETDWASLSFFSQHKEIERKIVNYIVEKVTANGLISRRVTDMFINQGLREIKQEVYSLNFTSYNQANDFVKLEDVIKKAEESGHLLRTEIDAWQKEVIYRKKYDLFSMQVNFLISTGTK